MKKRILLDLDDTVCHTVTGHLRVANEFLHTNYTCDNMPGYYGQDLIPEDKIDAYRKVLIIDNIYKGLIPFEDSVRVIEKLNRHYELYVLSSFVTKCIENHAEIMLKNKYEWIAKYLPFIQDKQYIFTSNKDMVEGDIIIDDGIFNLQKKREMKLLYTAYHNVDLPDENLKKDNILRVNNWLEIENVLLP